MKEAHPSWYNYMKRKKFKWGIIGLGTVTSGADVLAQYTFGVSYEVVKNLKSNFEYVMTPDLPDGNDNLRLALSITF